ncbi:MAG: GtrA family protein [Pseudomonadota bacterium]
MSELIRFFAVTVLGVMIDIAIAWALHTYAGVPLWLAATCGFVLAASGNYVLHQIWSFQDGSRQLSAARGAKYGAVALVTLAARIATVAGLERVWEVGWPLAILIGGAGVSFFVNFSLSKLFVFAERPTLSPPKRSRS